MSRRTPLRRTPSEISYDAACGLLERVLSGAVRSEILDAAQSAGSFGDALAHLHIGMRAHTFPTASAPLVLQRLVDALDGRSRQEGLHVLQSWDFQAQRFRDDIAPVLMLDYCARRGVPVQEERSALAILLDQYFLSIVSLLAVRAWDEGDANGNVDRVTGIIQHLNGPSGSGQRFIDDAETLLLLAISHYHPEERAYDLLLEKVSTLDEVHRLRIALVCAATLGSHLRWGFRFMYRRDVGVMRADNVVDYPWLLFSMVTLLRAYSHAREAGTPAAEREGIVEGLLNGLTADPWAFSGKAPAALQSQLAEHAECCETLDRHRADLLTEFETHRPSAVSYTPFGFACNFLSNAFTAMVATALGDPTPHPSLNALFTRAPRGDAAAESPELYARTLMAWSQPGAAAPGAGALIVYDPYDAIRGVNAAQRVLGEAPDHLHSQP